MTVYSNDRLTARARRGSQPSHVSVPAHHFADLHAASQAKDDEIALLRRALAVCQTITTCMVAASSVRGVGNVQTLSLTSAMALRAATSPMMLLHRRESLLCLAEREAEAAACLVASRLTPPDSPRACCPECGGEMQVEPVATPTGRTYARRCVECGLVKQIGGEA